VRFQTGWRPQHIKSIQSLLHCTTSISHDIWPQKIREWLTYGYIIQKSYPATKKYSIKKNRYMRFWTVVFRRRIVRTKGPFNLLVLDDLRPKEFIQGQSPTAKVAERQVPDWAVNCGPNLLEGTQLDRRFLQMSLSDSIGFWDDHLIFMPWSFWSLLSLWSCHYHVIAKMHLIFTSFFRQLSSHWSENHFQFPSISSTAWQVGRAVPKIGKALCGAPAWRNALRRDTAKKVSATTHVNHVTLRLHINHYM